MSGALFALCFQSIVWGRCVCSRVALHALVSHRGRYRWSPNLCTAITNARGTPKPMACATQRCRGFPAHTADMFRRPDSNSACVVYMARLSRAWLGRVHKLSHITDHGRARRESAYSRERACWVGSWCAEDIRRDHNNICVEQGRLGRAGASAWRSSFKPWLHSALWRLSARRQRESLAGRTHRLFMLGISALFGGARCRRLLSRAPHYPSDSVGSDLSHRSAFVVECAGALVPLALVMHTCCRQISLALGRLGVCV